MIEILVLIFYTRKIGSILQAKGRQAGGFKVLTVVLWFGCEFLGMILAYASGTRGYAIYPSGLLGAATGAGLAYVIANHAVPYQTATPTEVTKNITTGMMMLYGAGLLLLTVSFFEWNNGLCINTPFGRLCARGAGADKNAWHGVGLVMGFFLIALLVWEALLLAEAVSLSVNPILISLGIGALTVLFGVIRVFEYGSRTWAAWVALLLMITLVAGLVLRYVESEAEGMPVAAGPPVS